MLALRPLLRLSLWPLRLQKVKSFK
jgi:hypothetical protein